MIVALGAIVVFIAVRLGAGARRRARPGYFSARYRERTDPRNASWGLLRVITFGLTLGRDVVFPVLPAQTLDHLGYGRLGREWPLRDVVPLSRATHAIVTAARDVVGRGPVNFVLRAAFVAWLVFDYEVIALVANARGVGLRAPVPWATIAAHAAAGSVAVSRWLAAHLHFANAS